MTLKTFTVGGSPDTIACITLFGRNRHPEVLDWHQRVMVGHWGIPMNYLEVPFETGVSHGAAMNHVLRETVDRPDAPDHYVFVDNDAIFLQAGVLELIHSFIANRITLFGEAWESSHKTGPRGTTQHPYASQATIGFSRDLYNALGRPDCDHWTTRSDTAEELTYETEQRGYVLALIYPSSCVKGGTPLSQSCEYGMGNVYGPAPGLMYHCSRADLSDHVDMFTAKCKEVIG